MYKGKRPTTTVSFVSQKGGVGKSTLARLFAVGAAYRGHKALLADFDLEQLTCVEWNAVRQRGEIEPEIDARSFKSLKKLHKNDEKIDFVIADTRGLADDLTKELAEESDVVFLPTGTSIDDLRPTLALARKLAKRGAEGRIVLVLSKIGRSEAQIAKAIESIAESGFELLAEQWPLRDGFQTDLDAGRAGRELRNPLFARNRRAHGGGADQARPRGQAARAGVGRLADDLVAGEELRDLDRRRLRRVRAVHGILAHRQREILADGAGGGLFRIGRAHHVAIALDRVVAFERLHHHRRRGHHCDELAEERPLLVHAVECLGLRARHQDALLRDDAQPGGLDPRIDGAGEVAARDVGFENGKSPFEGHGRFLKSRGCGKRRAYNGGRRERQGATLTPTPLPNGRGALRCDPFSRSGEGGAKRRMRVCAAPTIGGQPR